MKRKAAFRVFIHYFSTLERVAKMTNEENISRLNIRVVLLSKLMQEGLPVEDCKTFAKFYKDPSGDIVVGPVISEELLKSVVQRMYDYLCEKAGPVETDKIFGRSLEITLNSEEALDYSPRQFF